MKEGSIPLGQIPEGYEVLGASSVELDDIFENLQEEGFPSIESLPSVITLDQVLEDFLQLELQRAIENRRMENSRFLCYKPDIGIIAGKPGEADFGRTRVRRTARQTLGKYNLIPLGTSHPHLHMREPVFSEGDLIYFLSHPDEFLMIVMTEEKIGLALKSKETSLGPVPLTYYRLRSYLRQLFKLEEAEALKEIREQNPEISGEKLRPQLHRLRHLKFDLRVAIDFSLSLYSSGEENPEILERMSLE